MMEKIFIIILTVVVVLVLCACSGGKKEETTAIHNGLLTGFAKVDILPEQPTGLGGFANNEFRKHTDYIDMPYATCVAFSENGNTILLYSVDTLYVPKSAAENARLVISTATGIPANNIIFSGTHSHSAPDLGDKVYREGVFTRAVLNAAQIAIADLAPTTLYGTKTNTDRMNFVRHYILKDGSYAGNGNVFYSEDIDKHAREADTEIQLVKADREGDKQDFVIMNWQCHPTFIGSEQSTTISADFIAPLRETFESETGLRLIYFSGASGDIVPISRITGEAKFPNDHKKFGAELAKYAIDALKTATKIEGGDGVKNTQNIVEYPCNRYGQDRLREAEIVREAFLRTGSAKGETAELAKKYGFITAYEANGIVSCSTKPVSDTMELNAMSFGGVGFITAPYEMFGESGEYIKENSPFEFTLIATCANGYLNYFPVKEAYEKGCYESYTAHFQVGVAEATADEFVAMLKSLK